MSHYQSIYDSLDLTYRTDWEGFANGDENRARHVEYDYYCGARAFEVAARAAERAALNPDITAAHQALTAMLSAFEAGPAVWSEAPATFERNSRALLENLRRAFDAVVCRDDQAAVSLLTAIELAASLLREALDANREAAAA